MSEILDIAHDMALDLVKVGAMDEIAMRKMDALRLPPKPALKPDEYEAFKQLQEDRRSFTTVEPSSEKMAAFASARMDERHAHLDAVIILTAEHPKDRFR